ncbi:hypothetical protein JDV02_009806 [Purpureocillium takamizusanense]|uniref:Uncharacterized protein n=1 Tax=Purpureocillium takamizusanense TaxID=2060973 RepID=A0A9Q8QRL6_9HYPO|nr:uncharacterized protein JDV02_009806 [Purpureocillium takamizusanense]UNI24026.1 hypothetical protein JDV02_009806 [Purpureocillium takamizusanense]
MKASVVSMALLGGLAVALPQRDPKQRFQDMLQKFDRRQQLNCRREGNTSRLTCDLVALDQMTDEWVQMMNESGKSLRSFCQDDLQGCENCDFDDSFKGSGGRLNKRILNAQQTLRCKLKGEPGPADSNAVNSPSDDSKADSSPPADCMSEANPGACMTREKDAFCKTMKETALNECYAAVTRCHWQEELKGAPFSKVLACAREQL